MPRIAHAVLIGSHYLILELRIVASTLGLQDERAPARQALGPLVPVLGVAVLADQVAAATLANWTRPSKASPSVGLDPNISIGWLNSIWDTTVLHAVGHPI